MLTTRQASISTFTVDRREGSLTALSQKEVTYFGSCNFFTNPSSPPCWQFLQASGAGLFTQLKYVYSRYTSSDIYEFSIGEDGLSSGRVQYHSSDNYYDIGAVAVDVDARIVYAYEGGIHALAAYPFAAGRRSQPAGISSLCGTLPLPDSPPDGPLPRPLIAAGGLLFTAAEIENKPRVCSHFGERLESREAFAFNAIGAAYLAPFDGHAARLALVGPTGLHVTGIGSDGRLQPQSAAVSNVSLREVLFHPRGQLLFTVSSSGAVTAYVYDLEAASIGGANALRVVAELPAGTAGAVSPSGRLSWRPTHQLAITLPAQ